MAQLDEFQVRDCIHGFDGRCNWRQILVKQHLLQHQACLRWPGRKHPGFASEFLPRPMTGSGLKRGRMLGRAHDDPLLVADGPDNEPFLTQIAEFRGGIHRNQHVDLAAFQLALGIIQASFDNLNGRQRTVSRHDAQDVGEQGPGDERWCTDSQYLRTAQLAATQIVCQIGHLGKQEAGTVYENIAFVRYAHAAAVALEYGHA